MRWFNHQLATLPETFFAKVPHVFFNDSQKGMFSDLPTLMFFKGQAVFAEMINFEPCKNPLRNQPRCSSQMAKVWWMGDRGMQPTNQPTNQPNQVVYTNKPPPKKTTQHQPNRNPKRKTLKSHIFIFFDVPLY